MNFNEFQKQMLKAVFRLPEAECIAWKTKPSTLRLQLHTWVQRNRLIRLKRGVYAFPERLGSKTEAASALYTPAYISLESALQSYGILTDVVFGLTLVSPKATRRFQTSVGLFNYHRIKAELFWGYDPETLMASCEKALVDYCYLYSAKLAPTEAFFSELRWHNLGQVNFNKTKQFALKTKDQKVITMIKALEKWKRSKKSFTN